MRGPKVKIALGCGAQLGCGGTVRMKVMALTAKPHKQQASSARCVCGCVCVYIHYDVCV